MKQHPIRTAVFCMTAAVLCLLLASCTSLLPSQITPEPVGDGIVLKTQFPVYAPDVPFIQFSITNNSGKTAEYGTTWSIEKFKDGSWYTVPLRPDTGFTMPLIMLADGGTASDTAVLSMLDHSFTDGTYRIVKEISGSYYAAEFEIGDSAVGKNSPYGYKPLDTLGYHYSVEMAAGDGATLLDETADFTRFFHEMSIGMNTQLRCAAYDTPKSAYLTDLTVEYDFGFRRIRYSDGGNGTEGNPMYSAYLVTNGSDVALSAYPTWQEEDYGRIYLHILKDNEAFLSALQVHADSRHADLPAVIWSDDGTKCVSLYPDREEPLLFGISEYYPDGGSAGHTVTIDTPGMKAIRGALWTGETTVMLICDVTDSSLDNMTGYVIYDTEKNEVTGYTYSQYAPINNHGTFTIPE